MAKHQYRPDEVSPPGETLLEVLEERGITPMDLAQRTGRPRKTINEIIKGKAAITPETASNSKRLWEFPPVFGTPERLGSESFLLNETRANALSPRLRMPGHLEPIRA